MSKSEVTMAFTEAHPVNVDTDLAVSSVMTKGQPAPAGHKRLTINIPMDLHRKLRLKALESGTTATDLIVNLLKQSILSSAIGKLLC